MKHFTSIILFSAVIAAGVTSCVKEKNFPVTPAIEFVRYESFGVDSADCIINFKDGDGDIGIVDGDTASPADFRMKYLYKDASGNFVPYDITPGVGNFDTLFVDYRVPDLMPNGQYKALDGEIRARLRSAPLYNPTHTIVKFEITLKDRAGHLSNMVPTNEITVPH